MASYEERGSMSMVYSAVSLNYMDTDTKDLLESFSIRKIPYKFIKHTSKALKYKSPKRKSRSYAPIKYQKTVPAKSRNLATKS